MPETTPTANAVGQCASEGCTTMLVDKLRGASHDRGADFHKETNEAHCFLCVLQMRREGHEFEGKFLCDMPECYHPAAHQLQPSGQLRCTECKEEYSGPCSFR